MADLNTIGQINETAMVEVYNPVTGESMTTDDGAPMEVEVYGQDSAHYKAVDRSILNRNIGSASRRGKLSLDAEQLDAQAMERTSKCVKSWNIQYGGEVPGTDPETVKRILTELPWLREQIEAGVADRARFLKGSSVS